MPSAEAKYCLCCGEDVPYNTISRQGQDQETCQYCGFVLNIKKEEIKKKKAKNETAAVTVDCILLADDSPLTRDIIKAMLLQKKVAQSVQAFSDGQQLASEFTKRLTGQSSVAMIILDLQMPVMDGITTARIVRNLEEKFKTPRIPILFFSARKCDEPLKKQMALFSPAVYLNKGSDTDSDILLERVDQLMSYILSKSASPAAE